MTQAIAGIKIPDSALARATTDYIREQEHDLLFNHSRRVFLWGALTGERKGLKYDAEQLYVRQAVRSVRRRSGAGVVVDCLAHHAGRA